MNTRLQRRGRMNLVWMLLAGGLFAVAALVVLLNSGSHGNSSQSADTLVMCCAAGLSTPVEEVVQQYEQEYGVKIDLQYGGSQFLLNQLEINKFGAADLYLAADDYYTDLAQEEGLAAETMPISYMSPVIAVRKDRKKKITNLDDLLAEGVSVALADPNQAAVGKATRERLQKVSVGGTNRWEQLEQRVTADGVFKPTVNEVATDVSLGAVDAAIVWDFTVAMPEYSDELEAIHIPELDGDPQLVSVCVLKSSKQATAALKFARYLTARDRGLPHFEKFGMRPVVGDVWAERPEVTFFCGAVNRLAVESIVEEFAAREGVEVNTVFDGCGILTGKMKTIVDQSTARGFPDVYMACDVYYLENVKEWFQEAANVSDTEIVMVVPKGSTKVKSLDDLLEPGIRVAIGQPEQCTIGALTRGLLEKEGVYEKLIEKQRQPGETVVEKPSSANLVPDVTTGNVDVALAYITDALRNRTQVDIIKLESPFRLAVQPFSISKSSDHKYLLRRLFKKVAASPEAFERAGFNFRLNKPDADAGGAAPSTDTSAGPSTETEPTGDAP